MKHTNRFFLPALCRIPGKMIIVVIVSLLFSATLSAQEKKVQQRPVTVQPPVRTDPIRRQETQPPKQVVQQPRPPRQEAAPVRPSAAPVRSDERVKQQPVQVISEPPVKPVRSNTIQPVPANPVKDQPAIAQPDVPVREPALHTDVPAVAPVNPKIVQPKQDILVDQAPAQQGVTPAQPQQPQQPQVVVPPIRVAPAPPLHVTPVYDPRNPNWRYSHLPRRHSHIYYLPSGCQTIYFGNYYYRYYNGIFYQPFGNYFMVIPAPFGIYIDMLPFGYSMYYVNRHPYFYYNGTYFDYRNDYYYVVPPPVGALVESLPDGYSTIIIDGETYYEADGAQYKPEVQENGEIWFRVIKSTRRG